MDFDWIEEQCQYTEHDVKWIKDVCKYFGHRTIQSYLDKLKTIRKMHMVKIKQIPPHQTNRDIRIEYYQNKINMLDERLPMLQLMADTHPEDLYNT